MLNGSLTGCIWALILPGNHNIFDLTNMILEVFELYARFLQALAHSRRLEIIHLLRNQEMCVGDIYKMLDLPQANISQHLLVLKQNGVVKTRRKGKYIFYSIIDPDIIKASDLLKGTVLKTQPKLSRSPGAGSEFRPFLPLVHDPVCNMQLSPKTAAFLWSYRERDYYFCASGCYKKFKESPQLYVNL